jgi:DNA-binding NarL/FixJ family response regulator
MSDHASPVPATTTERRRVAIVDDHELLLDGLTTWVKSNAEDLDVVVSVTGWFELIRDPAFPPEVTIMDFQLREPVSIETRIRTCLAAGSQVVVVSALETAEVRERVLAAGAAAFVAKSRPAEDVVDAVRDALDGGSRRTAAELGDDDSSGPPPFDDHRVIDTLRLYASGNSPVDIALTLGLPFEVVKGFLTAVRDHYLTAGRSAGTKQELIRRAAEDGYLL